MHDSVMAEGMPGHDRYETLLTHSGASDPRVSAPRVSTAIGASDPRVRSEFCLNKRGNDAWQVCCIQVHARLINARSPKRARTNRCVCKFQVDILQLEHNTQGLGSVTTLRIRLQA